MIKNQIAIKELMAGALLYFGRFTSIDISLIMRDFFKMNPNFSIGNYTLDELKNYIKKENDVFYINYNLKNGSRIDSDLKSMMSINTAKYFSDFNIEEFTLRKIAFYSNIAEENVNSFFSSVEEAVIEELIKKGYLVSRWEECSIYDDYKVIELSKLGKLKLFKIDNACLLSEFIKLLNTMRYDTSILDDFLLTQDLDLPASSILNINQLEKFSKTYDRALSGNGVSEIIFNNLKSVDNNLSLDSKNILEEIFSFDNTKSVFITHPNYIFKGNDLITWNVKELYNVNWNEIDLNKMLNSHEFTRVSKTDIDQLLFAINASFRAQLKSYNKVTTSFLHYGYLAIVEVSNDNAFVRGIIRKDSNGNIALAINPNYVRKSAEPSLVKKIR